MINKGILLSALTDKFKMLTFHSIVNECFISGLPMDKSDIDANEKVELTRYSYNVLNRLGGFSVLESAFDVDKKSLSQNLLLSEIYSICTEAATDAAKRTCDETDCKDPATKFDDVVDKAAFTDAEYKKFVSKANGLGLDEVSDIIKEKTLAVIKDEHEQYEKEAELDEDLKNALDDADASNDEASVESYVSMFLDKSAPRHHITVFSKIQESAMEMMNITKVKNYGEDIFPIVNRVTFESFLDDLKISKVDFDKIMESAVITSMEDCCDVPVENRGKMATLVSIIVYTVMETLKTMNLYCPSQDSIKAFVNKQVDGYKVANEDNDAILNKAESKLHESDKSDYSKMDSRVLSSRLSDLKKMSEAVQESITINPNSDRVTNIMTKIDRQVEDISHVLHTRNAEMDAKKHATESYYSNYQKSNDLAQFNKIGNMFGKNPNISDIRLRINPEGITSIIDVECANEAGQVIKKSFMNMEYACESSKYVEYLKDTYQKSKLSSSDKTVSLVLNDGSGEKMILG